MSNSDPVEWSLYSSNLSTKLAILPYTKAHLYTVFQEPGSGELHIPYDSSAADLISSGMFIAASYRGALRGGFFVDNIKITDADNSENAGRILIASGRGLLSLLEDAIVWYTSATQTRRAFIGTTKASIIKTLIEEAQIRGALANVDIDFDDDLDSDGVSWADSDDYDIEVGRTLLDVLRMLASKGDIEFKVTLQNAAEPVLLSAYSTGVGDDKSASIFFRVGVNCQEVGSDERGDSIKNAYLTKWRDGYIETTDSASITARRRREILLNIEAAQSGESARTFAAAKLDLNKDPRVSHVLHVHDGVKPRLYVDYDIGDTVTIDKFGTLYSLRVLGIQADLDGDVPSNVVLEINDIFYDFDIETRNDLDDLLNRWNTAKDANEIEVRRWRSIGQPNGPVYALFERGDYIYVGGDFSQISGKLVTNNIAAYNKTTGVWSALGPGLTNDVYAISFCFGVIMAATADKVFFFDNVSAWYTLGTFTGGTQIKTLLSNTTENALYVGGTFTSVDSVPISHRVAKYDGSWTSAGTASGLVTTCEVLGYYDGRIYGGFQAAVGQLTTQCLKYLNISGEWTSPMVFPMAGATGTSITALSQVGSKLIYQGGSGYVFSWDGVSSSSTLIATLSSYGKENQYEHDVVANYLSDAFLGAQFISVNAVTGYNNIARYSGGTWIKVGTGLSIATPVGENDRLNAILATSENDILIGGKFTTVDGKSISNLAIYITTFESLLNHLANDNEFDLAAHLADTVDAHDASAISVLDAAGNFTGTDVEAVLAELWAAASGGSAHIIQDEGVDVTQRGHLNFIGNNVFLDDDGAFDATNVYISSVPGHDIQGDGVLFPARMSLNFVGFTVSDNSLLDKTVVTAKTAREVLAAARTYYVRTDGADTHTGLVNSAAGAFLTIQKAIDVISANLDLNIYDVTIQLGNGTYSLATQVTLKQCVGAGQIIIVGDETTPANVIVSSASGINCFSIDTVSTIYNVRGMKFTGTGSTGFALTASMGTIRFQNVNFGSGHNVQIRALAQAYIGASGNYTISAGASIHARASRGGIIQTSGVTLTLSGTPAFTTFVQADEVGELSMFSMTFSGTATGQRYVAATNGLIFVNGAATTYLPGSTAGATSTGGQYA